MEFNVHISAEMFFFPRLISPPPTSVNGNLCSVVATEDELKSEPAQK